MKVLNSVYDRFAREECLGYGLVLPFLFVLLQGFAALVSHNEDLSNLNNLSGQHRKNLLNQLTEFDAAPRR